MLFKVGCIFCDSDSESPLLPTSAGKWAHTICALMIPGISIVEHKVEGIRDLSIDSWNNTCELCGSSKGICIGCKNLNCIKMFHVTCLQSQGLLIESAYEGYCKKHHPLIVLEKNSLKRKKYHDEGRALSVGDEIGIKLYGGHRECGVVVDNNEEDQGCTVRLHKRPEEFFVKWVYIRKIAT